LLLPALEKASVPITIYHVQKCDLALLVCGEEQRIWARLLWLVGCCCSWCCCLASFAVLRRIVGLVTVFGLSDRGCGVFFCFCFFFWFCDWVGEFLRVVCRGE
jgi:hypothetical protein